MQHIQKKLWSKAVPLGSINRDDFEIANERARRRTHAEATQTAHWLEITGITGIEIEQTTETAATALSTARHPARRNARNHASDIATERYFIGCRARYSTLNTAAQKLQISLVEFHQFIQPSVGVCRLDQLYVDRRHGGENRGKTTG